MTNQSNNCKYEFTNRSFYKKIFISDLVCTVFFRTDPIVGKRPYQQPEHMLAIPLAGIFYYNKAFVDKTITYKIISLLFTETSSAQDDDVLLPSQQTRQHTQASETYVGMPKSWDSSKLSASGVRICIVDSGFDKRIRTSASSIRYESFIDAPPDEDPFGHGTQVATVLCGCYETSVRNTGLAKEVELLVAKVYGVDDDDREIPPMTAEIAVAWGMEKGANIIVLALGKKRNLETRPGAFTKSISRLLAAFPEAIIVAAAGLETDALSPNIGVQEPAVSKGAFSVAEWNEDLPHHQSGCPARDSFGMVHFSGPSKISSIICYSEEARETECTSAISEFRYSSAACAYVAQICALHYTNHIKSCNKRAALFMAMATSCWQDEKDWNFSRGGFGIPTPPQA